MDQLVYLGVRTVFGVFLASVLGAVGLFAGLALWFPSLGASYRTVFMVFGSGIAAGIGGFVGWLRPEETWAIITKTLGLALVGGLGGAWGGLAYGGIAYEGSGYSNAARVSMVLGAAVGANGLTMLASIFWVWRGHKL